LRIAIKAVQTVPGGGLTHLNKIIEWFGKLAPEREFLLLGKTGQESLFVPAPSNFRYLFYRIPGLHLAAQIWWERQALPGLLSRLKCDLLFEPGNRGTLHSPCPKISLMHNIAPFNSEYLKWETPYQKLRQSLLGKATIASMKSSQGIIFLSNYSRRLFSKHLDFSGKKTIVIYHGRLQNGHENAAIPAKYGIAGRFLLSVSHIWRYKKILEMVKSYIAALERERDLPSLVIAGTDYSPSYTKEIKRVIQRAGAGKLIKFIGRVDESDLPAFYRNCQAFLFPSVIEACPNILIEAMSCGCAVACSNKSVVPEITAGAAIYYDPDDIADFSAKIISIATDSHLRQSLARSSRNRARFFSWEKASRQTLNFFDDVLESGRPLAAKDRKAELARVEA
jgi:glycosyltransferase involved in cell wall biosynthesis